MSIPTEAAMGWASACDFRDLPSIATTIRSLAAERDMWRAENIKKQTACEQMGARITAFETEIEKLRAALRFAVDAVEHWASYASPYFQEKHDLAGDLQKLRAALGEKE
jgi:hypothetical protein